MIIVHIFVTTISLYMNFFLGGISFLVVLFAAYIGGCHVAEMVVPCARGDGSLHGKLVK